VFKFRWRIAPCQIYSILYRKWWKLGKKFYSRSFTSALTRSDNPSFFWATVEDNPVIKLLIDKINLDIPVDSHPGEKLIHLASRLGKTKIVEALLKNGANINEKIEAMNSIEGAKVKQEPGVGGEPYDGSKKSKPNSEVSIGGVNNSDSKAKLSTPESAKGSGGRP
jgi:ankyrin repeat protein